MSGDSTLPIVSIGIPCYNRPEGLEKALNNLINQSYTNLEIIISDNNSENPRVKEICENFQKKDCRVKYYGQKINIGMFENFKFVLKMSSGKYFMWASDDDLFKSSFIEKCLFELEKNTNLSMCSSFGEIYDGNNKEITLDKQTDFDTVGLKKIDRLKKILFYVQESHAAFYCLHRTSIIKNIKLRKFIDADGLLLLNLSLYGEFKRLNEKLFTSQFPTEENKSITLDKEKFLKANNIKPTFFILRNEKFSVFIFYVVNLLLWRLNVIDKIKLTGYLYRSLWGYNTFRLFSVFRTINFLSKKKKIVITLFVNQKNLKIVKENLKELSKEFHILISCEEKYNDELNCFTDERVHLFNPNCETKVYRDNITLTYVKDNFKAFTHCAFVDLKPSHKPFEINDILNKRYKLNSAVKLFNRDILLFPLRDFVFFKKKDVLTIRTIEF